MLKLNIDGMSPENLQRYHAELVAMSVDPMTAEEREDHRAWRSRVATRVAFAQALDTRLTATSKPPSK